MHRFLPLLFAVSLVACSARVEYPRAEMEASPSAIDINTATVDELEKLPHIGAKTAEAIVLFRTENGPFRRVENLMLIRGMSESRFTELRAYVRTQ